MGVSVRSLLPPAAAVGPAGTVALSPVLVVAPGHSALAAPSFVDVRTADVALAGIGQDIYYSIQPWVGYAVEVAQYAVSWIPLLSSQIGILYFQGIQPVVEAIHRWPHRFRASESLAPAYPCCRIWISAYRH